MTRRRLLTAVTITLAAALTAWLVVGAWIARSACCWLSPTWLVTGLFVVAGLNTAAMVVLLVSRSRWGLVVLAGVEVGNLVFSLAASVAVSPAWLPLGAAPALVVAVLLFVLLRPQRAGSPPAI